MIFVFLFLTYFTQHNTLWVHPRDRKWYDFILFYCCVLSHCAVHMSQIFFSHLSIDGHFMHPCVHCSIIYISQDMKALFLLVARTLTLNGVVYQLQGMNYDWSRARKAIFFCFS